MTHYCPHCGAAEVVGPISGDTTWHGHEPDCRVLKDRAKRARTLMRFHDEHSSVDPEPHRTKRTR